MNSTDDHITLISKLAEQHLESAAVKIDRFKTGLINFVYDVELQSGRRIVARLSPSKDAQYLKDGLYWQAHLENLGVRLPHIYAAGEMSDIAFALLERLPGEDIELVYPSLSSRSRKTIASELTEIQDKVGRLDLSFFTSGIRPWTDVLATTFARSDRDFARSKLFKAGYVPVMREAFKKIENELNALPLTPFLYDTNLKNVILDQGHISGIIDVDEMWLGDPLLAVGRGKTLLLLRGWDLELYDYWIDCLNLTDREKYRAELYATLYCVRTMSILGREYNGNIQIENDVSNAEKIESITRKQMAALGLKVV